MIRFCTAWMVLFGAVLAPTPVVVAGGDDAPLQYRRVYIDTDQPPPDNGTYLPVAADEFEALVAPAGGETPAPARLRGVELHTTLDEEGLLSGEMLLDVEHTGSAPVLVDLGRCNLPLTGAVEVNDGGATPVLGTRHNGHLGVVIDRPLTLRVPWAIDKQSGDDQSSDYPLLIPECSDTELSVVAPRDVTISLSRGVLQALDHAAASRTWRFAVGAARRLTLHATRPSRTTAPTTIEPTVRQRTTYDVSAAGIQLLAEFELDAGGRPIERTEVVVPRDFRVVSIEAAGQPVEWRTTPNTDPAAAQQRLRVDFAEPVQGKGYPLTVRGFAAGLPDGTQSLPVVRLPGTFWQQGTIVLRVASPLEVVQLAPSDCLQTGVRPLADPLTGEVIELQMFDPAATVVLTARPRPVRLEVQRVDELALAADGITARSVARFSVERGNRFRFEADVDEDMVIETVRTEPTDALDDWFVEPNGNSLRLTVRLREAVAPEMAVAVVIEGARSTRRWDGPWTARR
ncbi:MAG: hypothetical protein R3C10_14435 [Pirellulales bacterium]